MSTLESLRRAAQALPYTEQQKLIKALHIEAMPDDRAARLAAIRQARGSLKGILPLVDEFLAEKHFELERSRSFVA